MLDPLLAIEDFPTFDTYGLSVGLACDSFDSLNKLIELRAFNWDEVWHTSYDYNN